MQIWNSGILGPVNLEILSHDAYLEIWKPEACTSTSVSRGQSEHHEHQSVSGLVPKANRMVRSVRLQSKL